MQPCCMLHATGSQLPIIFVMNLNAGDLLNNKRYRIERELARGGMGVIYEAHDCILRNQVAVKQSLFSHVESSNRVRLKVRLAV